MSSLLAMRRDARRDRVLDTTIRRTDGKRCRSGVGNEEVRGGMKDNKSGVGKDYLRYVTMALQTEKSWAK